VKRVSEIKYDMSRFKMDSSIIMLISRNIREWY
jgi:hypothetical protein